MERMQAIGQVREYEQMSETEVKKSRHRRSHGGRPVLFQNGGLWIAFLAPVLIMVIIFIQRGIFPFGDQTYLRTDLYHQYAPFFSEFRHKLQSGGSLLYSWDIGLGVNFAALYAYYLASPLNWLLILCPKGLVIEFITVMIVLKTGLCGLTFAWYLKKKCRSNSIGIGFFGIFYALSGYMAAYSWNIMWLDCILLFPLIVWDLEQLVKKGNGFFYCVTLGLSILSNYYISIMTCVFMVMYFFCLLILEKKITVKSVAAAGIRFGIYSLLAGAMAAFVLLPEVAVLTTTASGDINFPKTLTSYFTIFDMIARHIACVETEIGLDHWPNLYCGTAVLMFFLLYLACRKISVKEKAVYCGLLLIFFASFSVNVLNFMWHGFHYPNSLPCRQSFIYIFLMLFLCFRAFMYLKRTPRHHIACAFWGSICFVLLAEKMVEQEHFHFSVFYVAILFLAMYAGLIYMYRSGRRERAALLALALVCVEAAVNTTVTSVPVTSREAYVRDNEEVRLLMEYLEPAKDFYRVEKKSRKTKNDGAWMNFPSVSLFSSTANADLTTFFKRMGCEASTNAYSITGSTPLVDSLLSVKYALYSEEVPNTTILEYMRESGGTYLYENLYTLPLGVVVPRDLDNNWQYDMSNPAEVQNDLCQVLGLENVLIWEESTVNGAACTFTPDLPGEYYAYVTNKKVKEVTASLPSGEKKFNNVDRGYLLELGNLLDGNEVTLTCETENAQMQVEIYRFSDTALMAFHEKMTRSPYHLTSWTDSRLSGTVHAEEAGALFLSIPYDEGWTVTIDGEEAETYKIFDAFTAVNVPEGDHEVTLTYFPGGLKAGLMISVTAVVILVSLYFAKHKFTEDKFTKDKSEKDKFTEDNLTEDNFTKEMRVREEKTKEDIQL